MALSAIYVSIARVNIGGGQSQDNHVESNISATTSTFNLSGGRYGIIAGPVTGSGSLTLQVISADQSTFITAATAITAAGVALVDLPQGNYRWAVA